MAIDISGWRPIEFGDVPSVEEFKSLTMELLARGVTNSDRMRDVIRADRKWIVTKSGGNWNDTPSGKFTNQHAFSLKELVQTGVIVEVAEKEYRIVDSEPTTAVLQAVATTGHNIIAQNRLSMALRNNGFHIEVDVPDGWMAADATSAPGRCFLKYADADAQQVFIGTSLLHVARTVDQEGWAALSIAPPIAGIVALYQVRLSELPRRVERLYELSLALPSAPRDRFRAATAKLPATTEAERWVIQRVGQDVFREALLAFWSGRCVITGIDQPELLRASHIKPWRDCASDEERLDPMNGLLLAAHWDAAFDAGLVTFSDDGTAVFSNRLSATARRLLQDDTAPRLTALHPEHMAYLGYHRTTVFERAASGTFQHLLSASP